jgi:cytochrome P450
MKTTLPPGPRPLPFFGNLPVFFLNPTGYFQRLQRTYGDLVTFYQYNQPVILLFRPEDVHYVLVEHPAAFRNLPAAAREDETTNEGLLTIDGEKHRQQRRAVQPAFHKKQIANYAAIMSRYTQELLDRWQVGETVNMSRAMRGLTLRIISKCLFSIDVVNQLDLLDEAFTALLGTPLAELGTLFRLRIDHLITAYGKRTQVHHRLDILVNTLIMQRRGDDRDWGDVLSMLLMAPDGERAGLLHNEQIHDHITTFLTAGHETTALALTWAFL